ncbi:MAG: hypothetical protein K0R65_1779 [Crocinitomicaceae bacterium]|jgi:hypothetical protein|nr:hypothetical protein [Crocinitomicaceae bacterium]
MAAENTGIKRVHLFEFEDLSWFPDIIRTGGTDYLRYFLIRTELYRPVIPLLSEMLRKTGESRVIDLCSGGGGYIEQVYRELNAIPGNKITITLTDKFPNVEAYAFLEEKTQGGIDYIPAPVDVFNIPRELKGFRVLFSAVHHFKPDEVKKILQNAVDSGQPIGVFDGGEKGIAAIFGLLLIHPVAFLLCTPFFKPFKFSRLLFTYILPLIPLYTIWDGIVSILRMYRPGDLMQIAASLPPNDFTWKSGKTKNRFGIRASYLIAYPSKNEN